MQMVTLLPKKIRAQSLLAHNIVMPFGEHNLGEDDIEIAILHNCCHLGASLIQRGDLIFALGHLLTGL